MPASRYGEQEENEKSSSKRSLFGKNSKGIQPAGNEIIVTISQRIGINLFFRQHSTNYLQILTDQRTLAALGVTVSKSKRMLDFE